MAPIRSLGKVTTGRLVNVEIMHMFVRVREMIAGHADLLRHLDVLEHPSVQCRASHSLYFIVKDHPFVDRNKRIGTLLFLDWPRAAS